LKPAHRAPELQLNPYAAYPISGSSLTEPFHPPHGASMEIRWIAKQERLPAWPTQAELASYISPAITGP
jgi:hypothetical protein